MELMNVSPSLFAGWKFVGNISADIDRVTSVKYSGGCRNDAETGDPTVHLFCLLPLFEHKFSSFYFSDFLWQSVDLSGTQHLKRV